MSIDNKSIVINYKPFTAVTDLSGRQISRQMNQTLRVSIHNATIDHWSFTPKEKVDEWWQTSLTDRQESPQRAREPDRSRVSPIRLQSSLAIISLYESATLALIRSRRRRPSTHDSSRIAQRPFDGLIYLVYSDKLRPVSFLSNLARANCTCRVR